MLPPCSRCCSQVATDGSAHLSSDGTSLASKFDLSKRTLKIEGNDKPLVLFFYASSRI
ncbi:hypothetical protein [Campylobacter sp.]|uniref:hypothetical protein n=1 Tax=Campylobacter sp. TaxID=205 RepID=UPI0025BE3193|nr:hypothetical protein [Campylobacter sp.]